MIRATNILTKPFRIEELPREIPKPDDGGPLSLWAAQLDGWWLECRTILSELAQPKDPPEDDTTWKVDIASLKIRASSVEADLAKAKAELSGLSGTGDAIEAINQSLRFISDSITHIQWRIRVIEDRKEDFEFVQNTPLTPWVITHPIGRRVNVRLMDLGGNHFECETTQPDTSTVIVMLNGASSGRAMLS